MIPVFFLLFSPHLISPPRSFALSILRGEREEIELAERRNAVREAEEGDRGCGGGFLVVVTGD